MEYFRTEDGQIQADLARRLGTVLKQYHSQIISIQKYEVSLSLSILQTLLTNCVELLNNMQKQDKQNNPLYHYPIDPTQWGFDENNIIENTFNYPQLTAEKVIRLIRNALSHPTKIHLTSTTRTTGYITKGDTSSIETIFFINSPDLNGKGKDKKYKYQEQAEKALRENNFPKNTKVYQTENGDFAFQQEGKPFHRIFEIKLSPTNLLTLTYSLASYLSHPLSKTWDGKTFNIQKLAA